MVAARPPGGGPTKAWGLFGLESAIDCDTPLGTNARRPRQKLGKYDIYRCLPPDRTCHPVKSSKAD